MDLRRKARQDETIGDRMPTKPRAKSGRAGGKARKPLSRERIELAALELIERDGLPAFSQRALARALGIEAMSLYHWYPSQLDLLNAVLDRVVGGLRVPAEGTPSERLLGAALAFRAVAHRYPAFVGGFVLPHRFNTEATLAVLESILQVFRDAGLRGEQAARRFRTWMHFVMGALLDETAGYSKGPGASNPPPDEVVAERFPLVTALGPYNRPAHHEAHFRFGVESVLRGL
jgi:AcrR family transcriptional regulator